MTELQRKKHDRLESLELMAQLSQKLPEVLGCAFVVPLTQVEYLGHYGMSRDDEAEAIAMQTAMEYEVNAGWKPTDVSANNEGYDIRSISPDELKRYIEVKGRSAEDGSVMISENEMNRLAQLGDAAWLYIVMKCKSTPELYRIRNPHKALKFELKSKGVQYFLPMIEWQTKISMNPAYALNISNEKKVYHNSSFPTLSIVRSNSQPKEINKLLLKDELKRLILQARGDKENPINQAMDLLNIDPTNLPMDDEELLLTVMDSDEISGLLFELKGQPVLLLSDDLQSDYNERTFYSYLIDLADFHQQ